MKLNKSLYSALQYLSTINDIFAYAGNGFLIAKEKAGSGFVEIKAPDNFFKEPFVIKSLSKLLRLFSFDKKSKDSDPQSIQDWTIEKIIDPATKIITYPMYIKSPGRTIRLNQGSRSILEKMSKDLVSKIDSIQLEDSIKFQITAAQYKQIMSDCSLLDLDRITIVSENEDTIKIYLTKTGKGMNDDFSSNVIECTHVHNTNKMSFLLNEFSLIDATDHQLEYGKYKTPYGNSINLLKVKSFCDNNLVVQKLIIADKGE